MANRGGRTINGIHFHDCISSAAIRHTHRFFIDGKLVSRRQWDVERNEALKAEAAAKAKRSDMAWSETLQRYVSIPE